MRPDLDILNCEAEWALGSIIWTTLVEVTEFKLCSLKSQKTMLLKGCKQCVSNCGKFDSGHRTGKGPFPFQSQRRTVTKPEQDYCTVVLILHVIKAVLNILQFRIRRYMIWQLPEIQAWFRKGRWTRSNCQHSLDHGEIRKFQKKNFFCFIDYGKALDCVDHNKLWEILKDMGILDCFTCLQRNL